MLAKLAKSAQQSYLARSANYMLISFFKKIVEAKLSQDLLDRFSRFKQFLPQLGHSDARV